MIDGPDIQKIPIGQATSIFVQVYRKATQSCETDTKRPKYVHNNMAASVSAELNELDRGYVDDLHAQVNAKLPRKVNSRRAFAYHNLKSFDVIRNPYESLPLDLQETLSPRPSNTGNPNNGWIRFLDAAVHCDEAQVRCDKKKPLPDTTGLL
ncbi:hypothetical protein QR680_012860 [Steinernema hermaphroditum]|uniref:Uncharacterized protein n=1 Tax=Steinernema hermaphroditum TaxID=289476 RepID=A0AA39I555_9BILA|nr:hypothetical protein QR680_012860 [Steinernema hermaphroditum]